MSLKRFALALAALVAAAAPAAAQEMSLAASQASSAVIRVDLSGGPASQSLTLPRGKSAIVELPVDARDVLVSDPKVADVVQVSSGPYAQMTGIVRALDGEDVLVDVSLMGRVVRVRAKATHVSVMPLPEPWR